MDSDRFDRLTRMLSHRINRRQAVRNLSAGSLTAAVGISAAPVAAQGDEVSCTLQLVATVRSGPSTTSSLGGENPGELSGKLLFAADSTEAVLRLDDGTELESIVQFDDHAVTIRAQVPLGGVLVLIGASADPSPSCAGTADGLFTGPENGDIGDWHGEFSTEDDADTADNSTADTGGSAGSGADAAAPAATEGAPPIEPGSALEGDACSQETDCYSGMCVGDVCVCANALEPCTADSNCCLVFNGQVCQLGVCCMSIGQSPCESENECCGGGVCVEYVCEPPPLPACAETGASCANAECCVGYCNQDFVCECIGSGEGCAGIGTGGCCTGEPCNNGLCP